MELIVNTGIGSYIFIVESDTGILNLNEELRKLSKEDNDWKS